MDRRSSARGGQCEFGKKNPQRRASGDGGLSAGALLCRGLFASTAERLKALDGATLVCGLERGGLLTQPAETN